MDHLYVCVFLTYSFRHFHWHIYEFLSQKMTHLLKDDNKIFPVIATFSDYLLYHICMQYFICEWSTGLKQISMTIQRKFFSTILTIKDWLVKIIHGKDRNKICQDHFTAKLLMKTPKLTKLLFSKFPQLIMIFDFFLKTPSSLFYLYNVYICGSKPFPS